MYIIIEKRTVFLKIKLLERNLFNLNNFIELFLDDGPFSYLRDFICGIATHNHQNKIFSVNLCEETDQPIIWNFLYKYESPISLVTCDGLSITVQANTPQTPLQMVTLFPMPFSVTQEQLHLITET